MNIYGLVGINLLGVIYTYKALVTEGHSSSISAYRLLLGLLFTFQNFESSIRNGNC